MKEALFLDRLSDEELACQAQAGSRSSFDELVSRYCQRLFYFLRSRMGTDQDAEDLVQETFLKAFNNLHRFDPAYKFSTWLYTSAIRLNISFFRKNRTRESRFISAGTEMDPQEKMMREEDSRNLWNTARKLPSSQFQVLWLRYIEEMSVPDIAVVLKKREVSVRVLLHRARLRLAEQLNPASRERENKNSETVKKTAAKKGFSFL